MVVSQTLTNVTICDILKVPKKSRDKNDEIYNSQSNIYMDCTVMGWI